MHLALSREALCVITAQRLFSSKTGVNSGVLHQVELHRITEVT